MATYLITGVSRGIGFEFLRQLSQDPANTVVGLVRDKATTDKKIAAEIGVRSNAHIIQADLTKYDELKASVAETSKITGGSLDYIIANAAFLAPWSGLDSISSLSEYPQQLEEDFLYAFKANVIGNVHLFNLYLPLVLKGQAKKVITISSGLGDLEITTKYSLATGGPYATSKAAMNLVNAKFGAEWSEKGVLFLCISPGVVDNGSMANMTEEQLKKVQASMVRFIEHAPDFKGPVTPEESVTTVLSLIYKRSVENGDGGAFISHLGNNKQWL